MQEHSINKFEDRHLKLAPAGCDVAEGAAADKPPC